MITSIHQLMDLVRSQEPKTIAVAGAADQDVADLLRKTAQTGAIKFILIDDQEQILELLRKNDLPRSSVEIHHEPNRQKAAEAAVCMARDTRCDVVMKGNLHTAVFLKAVLNRETGIATGDLVSQVTVFDRPGGGGLLLLTDCVLSIEPTLEEKKAIIDNAVGLARSLGIDRPKVALLSALELVNPKIKDTLEAAVLSKMAERGQIRHCVVDGPLALDNAVSPQAARHKGIVSPVAGVADILVAPNLQVGNVLHKSLVHFAGLDTAAAVMGTRKPLVMTSRTDTVEDKLLTIALALYTSAR